MMQICLHNIMMFPTTTKEHKPIVIQASPKASRDPNRSAYLPYFKRFPNQKFHSQERRRNQGQVQPQARRFFTQEKEEKQLKKPPSRMQSNPAIKEKSRGKLKPRLFRQIYERESTKKRISQHTLAQNSRMMVNSSFTGHNSANYLTPQQVLRTKHNLNEYEICEIGDYDQIFYYGQNCIKKLFGVNLVKKGKQADQGYPWSKGDHINYRYQLIQLLGQGSFGQVFKCLDHKHNMSPVALKIVKNNEKYTNQAKVQIRILNMINNKDPLSSKNCVEMKESFGFRQRVCMVFPLLSMNLYELIKSNGYYGLPLDLIRRFVLQMLNGIHFLHRMGVIHADLKPQNILLKEAHKSGIKIIDFGSSCLQRETIYTYIQSRYYRAPQVILGLSYNRKIDIWSLGCIIAELHLGFPLFGGEDEHEQICLLIEVLGMPPKDISINAKRWHVFFDSHNVLRPHDKKALPASKTLEAALEHPDEDFVDFIRVCLQWHPDRRTEALQLMKHKWVLKELPNQFKEQHMKFVNDQQANSKQHEDIMRRSSRKQTFAIRQRHRLIK